MQAEARGFNSVSHSNIVPDRSNHLWEVLRLVRLIWRDHLARGQLLVGVRWVDDELLGVAHNAERREAVASAELS